MRSLVRIQSPRLRISRWACVRLVLSVPLRRSILNAVLLKEILGDRRGHASYQGVVEQLRSFHRQAVPVELKMVDIEVLNRLGFTGGSGVPRL